MNRLITHKLRLPNDLTPKMTLYNLNQIISVQLE
jgi:hypothetical protein